MTAFHKPRTEPEKALDRILKLSDEEPESSWFAVGVPWRDKAKDSLYRGLLSQRLKDSWADAERKAVKENCNGTYVDGELCGIDIHPITCSQDTAETYLYRTVELSSERAIVEYRWDRAPKIIATYRLVHEGTTWVLDGVACAGYLKFNMP